jgi:hypothetical protein
MRGVESVSPQAQTCDDASILQYPGAGYSRKEAFLRLVVGDWIRGGSHDSDRKVTEQDLEDLWRLLGQQHSGVDHSTRQAAYRMVANQNMFATQNGLIGLGHLDVRAGDEVWIFKGGNLPFTIRPRTSEGEGGSYSFVGHCYVQGIMTGEVATRCIPWIDLVDRTVCLW